MTQEMKEMKKKAETLEDELAQSKKNFSKEMSELTQYYEQRVSPFALIESSNLTYLKL